MSRILSVLMPALMILAAPTAAQASLDMAKKNACMACHAVDKKLVGPAYQEVAKKYADQKEAAATLAASIRKGGSGKWGPVPMPAQAALSEADAAVSARSDGTGTELLDSQSLGWPATSAAQTQPEQATDSQYPDPALGWPGRSAAPGPGLGFPHLPWR